METTEHSTVIKTELNSPIRLINERTKEEFTCTYILKGNKDIMLSFEFPEHYSVFKDVLLNEVKK